MNNAENKQKLGHLQRDMVEPKGYEGVQSKTLGEHSEQFDTTHLMWRVVSRENIEQTFKAVKCNKGATDIDGITTDELESHIWTYYPYMVEKLMKASYKPQPVHRVTLPKGNGKTRNLGILVV